jgi:hypothetical protein
MPKFLSEIPENPLFEKSRFSGPFRQKLLTICNYHRNCWSFSARVKDKNSGNHHKGQPIIASSQPPPMEARNRDEPRADLTEGFP